MNISSTISARAGDNLPTLAYLFGGVVKHEGLINHETTFNQYIQAKMDLVTGKAAVLNELVAKITAKGYSLLNVTYFAQYIFQHILDNLSSACESALAFFRCHGVVEHILTRRWFFYATNKKVM